MLTGSLQPYEQNMERAQDAARPDDIPLPPPFEEQREMEHAR
jgi:hypothetical protein